MLYQWGRKDAFPGADGSTIQQASTSNNASTIKIYGADGSTELTEDGTGYRKVNITIGETVGSDNTTIVYATKNPLTFIYNATTPYDWYTHNSTSQNNTLWGDGDVKSDFDPCPMGWIVPANGTWDDFSSETFPYYIQSNQLTSGICHTTNGRLYHNLSWYAACGFRYRSSGLLNNVGDYGQTWSLSVIDIKSFFLRFTMIELQPGYAHYRAQAFAIRCVQE